MSRRRTFWVALLMTIVSFAPKVHGHHKVPKNLLGHQVAAPQVHFVHPPHLVALICDSCGGRPEDLPDWVLALGARLHSARMRLVPMASPPDPKDSRPFAAILSPTDPRLASPPWIPLERGTKPDPSLLSNKVIETIAPKRYSNVFPVRHLFVVRPQLDRSLFLQTTWVAYYGKLDADFLEASELAQAPQAWLQGYASVTLATNDIPSFQQDHLFELLKAYVEAGGGLSVLTTLHLETLGPLLGIRLLGPQTAPVTSVTCDGTWFPGAKDLSFRYDPSWEVTLPLVDTLEGSKIFCRATTSEGKTAPLVVSRQVGLGRTLVWLSNDLNDKSARGRILLSLLEVSQPAAASILDALVFYIDDCPMPMWGRPVPPLDALYAKSDVEYYSQIWWPGLKKVLDQYAIKPTFAFVLSYDSRVTPPFSSGFLPETEEEGPKEEPASAKFARALYQEGHEIALHGYNHQSLVVAKSEASAGWPGLSEMVMALDLTRKEFARLFGEGAVPRVYVAPNNLVHAIGKQAVLRVFPEVTGIAAQYLDEGPILGQEFGPDPDLDGVVDIPRISSESFLDDENALEVLDALISPGVFSHFIHADDIMDKARSRGLDFGGLKQALEGLLEKVTFAYPFLRRLYASDFAKVVANYQHLRLEVSRGPKSLLLRVAGAGGDKVTVFARIPGASDVKTSENCDLVFRSEREGRYYVRVGEHPCVLKWD